MLPEGCPIAVSMMIQALQPAHRRQILEIYQQGIDTGHATFEARAPDWQQWDAAHRPDCRLVAMLDDQVAGFAALAPVSARATYGGVAEVSVYVSQGARRRGLGRALLHVLLAASERAGIWTLQAGIFPENQTSIALHIQVGFREVGVRCKVGLMTYGPLAGRWRDVVLLERRSQRVGIAGEV